MTEQTLHTKEGYRVYELAFLVALEGSGETVKSLVTSIVGDSVRYEPVQHMTFAYQIKKHNNGFFGSIQFSAMPDSIARLKKALDDTKDIIRFLIIKNPITRQVRESRVTIESAPSVEASQSSMLSHEPSSREPLTNEALEAKLEEILK